MQAVQFQTAQRFISSLLEKVKLAVRETSIPTGPATWNFSWPAWIASVESPARRFFTGFIMDRSLTQSAGGPQAPNWGAAGKDFIVVMRRLHLAAENGKMKTE